MTVKELIKELRKYPKDSLVYAEDFKITIFITDKAGAFSKILGTIKPDIL